MNNAIATGTYGIFSLLSCFIPIIILGITLVLLALWIWMFIDVITRDENNFGSAISENAKVIWLLIILLTGYIGAGIYYFFVFSKYPKK